MQMQTSGKCQRPEHECQDSIASLRIGRESSHPSHAASVHACSKKLYHIQGWHGRTGAWRGLQSCAQPQPTGAAASIHR